jgi:hypothetical protein
MPTFGTVQRTKPRVVVLRGYDPQEPTTNTASHPVKPAVTIKSGQVISLEWVPARSRYEWVLGCSGNAIAHIALQDSSDYDVIEAGKLTGLSCLGQFVIQTPHYKEADAALFVQDTPVTYDGLTGDIKVTALESGEPIIGFVSRVHGPQDLTGVDSTAPSPKVVIFDTRWLPNTTDAT